MKKKSSFLKQASFLMVAGLLVRIIGLLYRTPMKATIGELGYGYYGYAYTVYNILLLISGYSIPVAVSKLMSERLVKKEYRNAQKVFKGAFVYVCAAGGLASLVAFVFAKQLLPQGAEDAVLALRVLAPTIVLAGILGVLRGYFQANNNMMPTAISQILEQIFNAFVSVAAGVILIGSFAQNEDERAIYGAAGGTLGTGVGVLSGILFMLFVFYVNRKVIKKKLRKDDSVKEETYGDIARVIFHMLTPVIFSTFIYNVSGYIDQSVFSPLMMAKGADAKEIASMYGLFTGQAMVLLNIPVALANASSTAMMPAVTGDYAVGNIRGARAKIDEAIHMTMFIAIPAAVGLAVLAFPIMELLFAGSPPEAAIMLIMGAISVIFYALSTITNGVLQGIGQQKIPVRNALLSLVVNILVLVVLTCFTPLGIYAVLLSTVAYSFTMCIVNQLAVRKYLDYSLQWKDAYLKPFGAAAFMGGIAWICYYGLHLLVPVNIVCLAIAVGVAILSYMILFIKFTGVTKEQMRKFPMGGVFIRIGTKIHLW